MQNERRILSMNKGNNTSSSSDKMITLIIVVVIIAVLGIGIYATYGKIANNITENKIASGEIPETVSHAANAAGMSVEDYLADFSLTVTDEVNGDTPVSDLYGYMSLENYMTMANEGNEEPVDLDAIIEEWGLTGKVTKDTQWKDVELLMPLKAQFSDEQINQYKQAYNLGDEVTGETTYGDFQKMLEEKAKEAATATAAPAAETPAE